MKRSRLSFYITLSVTYFIPHLIMLKGINLSLRFLIAGGVWSLLCLAIFIYFLRYIEKKIKSEYSAEISSRICQVEKKIFSKQKVDQNPVNLKKVRLLVRELEKQSQKEKALIVEIERLKNLKKNQEGEYSQLSDDLHTQLDKKETILSEYRMTLKEQRKIIEKKQNEINLLQIRVNDQKYEIDNLLKLKEGAPTIEKEWFPQFEEVESPEELEVRSGLLDSIQVKLDRYVKMATKLNGARHFQNKDYDYSELSLGSLIIDQRRLFDRLQNEEKEALLVYSRDEKKIVFVNQPIKKLFGWSPERFAKDFSALIQKGQRQWLDALDDVQLDDQKSIRLLVKARSGKDVLATCYLKEVPTGVFKGYVLGLLSSSLSFS